MSGNHNGLMADTTYYYRIFAVNPDDVDSLAGRESLRKLKKRISLAAPDELGRGRRTGKRITLYGGTPRWIPHGAPVTSYRIDRVGRRCNRKRRGGVHAVQRQTLEATQPATSRVFMLEPRRRRNLVLQGVGHQLGIGTEY